MRFNKKFIIIIFILGILLSSSAYIILYTENTTNNPNDEKDTEPPVILDVTGNLTITAGKTVTITALFSDNVNVTNATLYYQIAGATNWESTTILNGSVNIAIPSTATKNYYYYVTIDDAAGNGPVGSPSNDGSLYYIITIQPNDNTNGDNENKEFIHTVFVEESTSENCRYCPDIGKIFEELEASPDYRVYYVSLIQENNKAAEYLTSHYNWYANPTVYIDGGYQVILGGLNPEEDYTTAILEAQNRVIPNIRVTITAEYKNTSDTITTNVLVENGEQTTYNGRLRVYLTEIISSQFNNYNGLKYQNAFIDFIINQTISLPANSNKTYSTNWSVGTRDYENLKLIAVVFSSIGNDAYSNPADNEKPFTAYYADATNATYIVQGTRNLPPEVGIVSPLQGKIYFRGNLFFQFLYKNQLLRDTWLIGKSSIEIYAKDDTAITKVEIYIDNDLVTTFLSTPYTYTIPSNFIKKPLIPKTYTLMVKAYDDTNKTATASLDIKAWFVF